MGFPHLHRWFRIAPGIWVDVSRLVLIIGIIAALAVAIGAELLAAPAGADTRSETGGALVSA